MFAAGNYDTFVGNKLICILYLRKMTDNKRVRYIEAQMSQNIQLQTVYSIESFTHPSVIHIDSN